MTLSFRIRIIAAGLIGAASVLTIEPTGRIGLVAAQAEAETVRPEIGKLLQAAQGFLAARKYNEALARLHECDGTANLTSSEAYVVERTRLAIASASGDDGLAVKSLEALMASSKLPVAERMSFMPILAGAYYRKKDYPKAISWLSHYESEGGADPKMHALLMQTYYLNNEFARAAKALHADIHTAEKAGRIPSEVELQLLASCALKQDDKIGYADALEKFVTYYPKPEYWADLLNRVRAKPGFADRLSLDVFRLKRATGQLNTPNDFVEMTQLALQAGFPAEAKKVVEQGFQSGVLGTGVEAGRQTRLRVLANKNAAEDLKTMVQGEVEAEKSSDGIGLINLGYAYVTAGRFDKGIALMEQGLRKGNLKRLDDAKLHIGVAYAQAGQKAHALQIFKSVRGIDGTADLARYWMMQLNRPAK